MALSTNFRIAIYMSTPGRRQSKALKLSTNVDQKSLETEFSIAYVARLATNGNRKHCF